MADKNFNLANILAGMDRVQNADQDIRYMAVSDLTKELEKETYKPDNTAQKKIVQSLVTVLASDTASEVRSCAIKSLVPLIRKLGEESSRDIFESLSKILFENKDETTRDLAGSGMKIMLESLPVDNVKSVVRVLVPKLIKGTSETLKDRAQMSLDLLGELLARYGKEMALDADSIQTVVLPHITSKDSMNKKKSISCLGHLSMVSSDKQFESLLIHLLDSIKSSKEAGQIRTYVQCIGTLSRFAGNRMGGYVDKIFAVVKTYMDHKDFVVDEDKYDEELREICLQTLEALITRCPKELFPHLQEIEDMALKYMKHDPNRSDDMDVDEEEMSDGNDENDDEDDGDDDDYEEDFDDEDDLSWKVRKASLKVLAALFKAYPHMLAQFYAAVGKALVSRFAEHEDNVLMEVLNSFLILLHQTAAVGVSNSTGAGAEHTSGLEQLVPSIVKALSKLLADKSTKVPTRVATYQALRQLIFVLQGGFDAHLATLIVQTPTSFTSKSTSSALKTETLLFLNALLTFHNPDLFTARASQIWKTVESAIKDPHYKISSEGLSVCGQFVKILTDKGTETDYAKEYIPKVFAVTQTKFTPNELDKEVKEAAIAVTALEVSRAGTLLAQTAVDDCLKILSTRLNQEVVRAPVIKALAEIAESALKINLSSVITPVTETLTALLRQQSRALRVSAVSTLITLVQGGHLSTLPALLQKIVEELNPLVSAAESHLTQLALKLATAILVVSPSTASSIASCLLEPSLELFNTAALQGAMLDSLIAFLIAGTQSGASELSLSTLTPRLINLGRKFDPSASTSSRSFYHCLAQSIASLITMNLEAQSHLVADFVKDTQSDQLSSKLLALFTLGEIGRKVDLSSNNDVKTAIVANLEASVEDAKAAAAMALGAVAVGNLAFFLPVILKEVEERPKSKYLLLTSIREVIVSHARSVEGIARLAPSFAPLSSLLIDHTTSNEEGIRNIVAECWGKLALTNPSEVFALFVEKSSDSNAHTRSTVISALKYAISTDTTAHPEIDVLLGKHLDTFLSMLKDSEIGVRHATLLTLNYLSTHRPQLLRPVLPKYLPILYGETTLKPELITVVKLGPFEHKVDNGLNLRQAAYECMYTLLDTCLGQLNLTEFTAASIASLNEETSLDNKSLKLLLLAKLCQRAPLAVLAAVDSLVQPLTGIITTKPKDDGQPERMDELIRSAFRVVSAIQSIEGSSHSSKWNTFFDQIVCNAENKPKYEAIRKEAK